MSSIFEERVFLLPKYSQFVGKGLFLAVVTQFESSRAILTLRKSVFSRKRVIFIHFQGVIFPRKKSVERGIF